MPSPNRRPRKSLANRKTNSCRKDRERQRDAATQIVDNEAYPTKNGSRMETSLEPFFRFIKHWQPQARSPIPLHPLPRATNVVDAKLIGVAGPMRRWSELTIRHAHRLWHVAIELMVDRIRQILADTP